MDISDRPTGTKIAVVIPCFRGGSATAEVVRAIGPEVCAIYVIDDGCPDSTGDLLIARCRDARLIVLHNERNRGVGGAMKRGYARAFEDGADIVVKLDADGQMEPAFLPALIAPILAGEADYAKGNRFAAAGALPMPALPVAAAPMPALRLIGNRMLARLHKIVTGYWHVDDPTNGYTAIHRRALAAIERERLADCYFFETDMLFQLGLVEARVCEVALPARYGDEVSSLSLRKAMVRFPGLGLHRFVRRMAHKAIPQELRAPALAERPVFAEGSAGHR